MNVKAILFDFDGTLIDSQPVINEYLEHIFSHKHLVITDAEKKLLGGMSFPTMRAYLAKEKNIHFTKLERYLYNLWFVVRHLGQIKKFPHSEEMLKALKAQGYKLAIVTNSPRSYLDYIQRKEGIAKYFDVTVSVTESKRPKPDPTMLVMAARQLGVPFDQCMMVDDNEPGIVAGNTLGMQTVRIASSDKRTQATHVLDEVNDIKKLLLQQITVEVNR